MTPFDVLASVLGDLATAVRPLTVGQFARRDRATSGSIGSHVRHCLDHVDALERAIAGGPCCYDTRQRGTVVEHDPMLACARLAASRMRLRALDAGVLDQPLTLSAQVSADGLTVQAPTSVAREVAFVISHTVHHAALIAVLLEDMSHERPDRFGLAPTSPALEAACAR
jgi:uncharacterized damage-inducible protein DinB